MKDRKSDLVAPCGLFCGACDVYLANLAGTVAELASKWDKTEEELHCTGCLSPETAVYCSDCELRDCATARGIASRAECPDMPCEALSRFAAGEMPHHQTVIENLRRIQQIGPEAWVSEQLVRWRCACGQRFMWYEKTCPSCGANLHNIVEEAKALRGE